jgi:hypothetical protein
MSATALDPDVLRSASHVNMAAHLTAPFAGGARGNPVPIASDGSATVDWESREPLLLAAPTSQQGAGELVLSGTTAAGAVALGTLTFAPYTEAGAYLPLLLPAVDALLRTAQPFEVALTLSSGDGRGGPLTPLSPAEIAGLIELALLEGITGRLLYTIGAEKQRIRRQAREIAAMRALASARDDALDRSGADVGVPRFLEGLEWDAERGQVVSQTLAQPESDDDYRRRIGLYRPLLQPTLANVTQLLNGAGAPTDPNSGALSQIAPALSDRFTVNDEYNPFAVAIHLVSSGDDVYRSEFLQYVRATRLLWPLENPAADAIHSARFLPSSERTRIEGVRSALRDGYAFSADAAADPALAPLLADALNRLSACRGALGVSSAWTISRVQQNDGGSRYELGLGANLTLPAAAELDQLGSALSSPTRTPASDAETEALLASMTPRSSASDPDGSWLLEPCGLRTVQRLDATTLFVSHLPVFGLLIDGSSQASFSGWSLLVPGNFGGDSGADVFAYQRESASGQFFSVSNGELVPLSEPFTGLSGNWTAIVSGTFTADSVADGLLCYDATNGRLECHVYDLYNFTFTPVGTSSTGWSTTISQLVTGDFGATGYTNIALHDPIAGRIDFFDGNFTALTRIGKPVTDIGQGWTHLVTGDFSDSPHSDLLFYDAAAGRGAFFTLDGPGRPRLLAEHHDWQPGWSHVVSGFFYTGAGKDLLFYDRDDGSCELDSTDGHGNLTLIASHSDWARDWTHVIGGDWSGRQFDLFGLSEQVSSGGYTDLLLYNATSGRCEADALDNQLNLQKLGATAAPTPSSIALDGHYYAAESESSNVVLESGLTAALAAWASSGGEAPLLLNATDAATAWGHAAINDNARQALQDGGLANVPDPVALAALLPSYPSDQLATLRLGPLLTASLLAGQGADQIKALVTLLGANDLPSAVGFATSDGQVLLVVAVIGLPVAGLNLAERGATGFRWYSIPLAGMRAAIGPSGSHTQLTAAGHGLNAVVLIGYTRQSGVPDPYEFSIDLPNGAALSLQQYEFLMNLLDHAYPAGVGVNTYAIRQRHVALGDSIVALAPGVSRTYRPFRRTRSRGVIAAQSRSGDGQFLT